MELPCYLGVDIGATLIKMGIVSRAGELVSREEIATERVESPAHFLDITGETIKRLLGKASLTKDLLGAIGVGAPGWVDHGAGIVHEVTNIRGWIEIPLAEQLERETGLVSFVDNDVNAMALAEQNYGAGRGHRNLICLTLGTGVGGALIIDGKIYRGAGGLAGEIGHMTIDLNGPHCVCGGRGCLERYIGNRYIVANVLRRLENDEGMDGDSILRAMAGGKPENVTPKLLAEAAHKGDRVALEVWRDVGSRLGTALAALVNVLNPECFVIGGGVAQAGAVLFDPMRSAMESLAMNQQGKVTAILKAQLGEDAGIIGAAALAMECTDSA